MSDDMSAGGGAPAAGAAGRTRRMAEVATVVSAATALAALVFAVVGLTGGTGGTTRSSGPPGATSAPPAEQPSARPTATAPTAAPTTPQARPTPAESPLPPPAGWQPVEAAALTASLAVPDGWKIKEDDALRVNWISPDGRYVIGVKRDSTHGSTAQAASIGQLAWYRTSAESKMQDLTSQSHPVDQRGRNAVRLDLDFRWEGESRPSRRLELFVAGEHGQVYQLLAEDKHLDRSSELTTLFETARTHLRTDVP
ncbi:hypothetical protein [Streptomyces erythrochromogenes]|uniref:hypothetical protein n=1 Tax=Streptomyces erythrochromogenes TaxID=285574 RepID=UPI0036885E79